MTAAKVDVEVPTTRWAVIYQRGKRQEVWAVIVGVPTDVKLPEVREAIEQWSRWPAWQRRISSAGRVGFRPERRWPTPMYVDEQRTISTERIQWSTLAPVERRISVLVDSALWAAVRDRAATAGVSLAEYVRSVLAEEVGP